MWATETTAAAVAAVATTVGHTSLGWGSLRARLNDVAVEPSVGVLDFVTMCDSCFPISIRNTE